ncbi:MAG: heavy metal translocating P-type ATPase [Nitrososphaerota archaeon]
MAKDLVCGMFVDENKTPFKVEKRGVTYYFCSENCLNTFLAPERELRQLKILTSLAIILGGLTAFFEYFYPIHWPMHNYVLLFLLATPIQFIAGWRFYKGTWDAIKARQANMDSLIALGTTTAWIYSTLYMLQTLGLIPTIFPKLPSSGTEVYFTESGLIIGLVLLGRVMEHQVKERATDAVRKLLDLQPKMATVIRDGEEIKVPIEQVELDELLIVRPGEKVPTDGVIIDGYSYLDQSMVTGESVPVEKRKGDEVIGGTINMSGVIKVRATKVGEDTMLSQIIKMIEEAILSKAPMQRLADKVAAYFVPIVILVAVTSFVFWYGFVGLPLGNALMPLISVLIIACPCALGIATPAAILIGTSKSAQYGILIKGGEFLEKISKLDVVIFDKTGTLTKGELRVTDVVAFGDFTKNDVLALAIKLEEGSRHPLGEALRQSLKERNIESPFTVDAFEEVPGYGIRASINGRRVLLGNVKLMKDSGIEIKDLIFEKLRILEEEGKTVIMLAYDSQVIGLIAFSDTVKENARGVIQKLRSMGIKVALLTGDNRRAANAIANKLGVEMVFAEVLPNDKANIVKKLRDEGKIVAMVGDGINDAPALAQADVGIAIGSGTDIAKETGGIILVKNDLRDIVIAIDLSKKVVRKMKENLFWAFIYNIALIPIAAGILYPLGIMFNPIFAAAAMATSSVTVTLNSMLLNHYRPKILNQ